MRSATAAILSFTITSCSVATEPLDAGMVDAMVDAGTDADRYCHYDCFGGASCEDGVVTVWFREPIPCAWWTGSCGFSSAHVCAEGCRADITWVDDERLAESLCEEARPRTVGEPCEIDDDCRPTAPHTYLRCDMERCVTAEPPVVDDWRAQCGLDLGAAPTRPVSYMSAPGCSGGVCLLAVDDSCEDGVAQGCTIECEGHWGCPGGSVCHAVPSYDSASPARSVCYPGSPDALPSGLMCPSWTDCVTSFRCEAETAETECGVVTADGRRHPDVGAPYCSDQLTRDGCTCDLLRCTSPQPLCPGTYRMRARERLISGCNGVAGELGGTCDTLWNVAESSPDGTPVAESRLFNVDLSFTWAIYEHDVTLTAPTVVRMRVEQDAWLEDVSGGGNAGRAEVDWAELTPAP